MYPNVYHVSGKGLPRMALYRLRQRGHPAKDQAPQLMRALGCSGDHLMVGGGIRLWKRGEGLRYLAGMTRSSLKDCAVARRPLRHCLVGRPASHR